jgi:hypothetical protein
MLSMLAVCIEGTLNSLPWTLNSLPYRYLLTPDEMS